MRVVRALRDARGFCGDGQPAFRLHHGEAYALFDSEADAGETQGAVQVCEALDERLPRYAGQHLTGQRLLVPFIGGQGDAVVLGSCLRGLLERWPQVRIDVAAPALLHPVLRLLDLPPAGGEAAPGDSLGICVHPLQVNALQDYDYYMTLEMPERFGDPNRTSNLEIFCRCLSVPAPSEPVRLRFPREGEREVHLPEVAVPRVGIALTSRTHMRAYPVEQALQLARLLLEMDLAVVLMGVSREVGSQLPHAPPRLVSAVDHTPSVASLAALVARLDLMICPDSLFMHLAGALRVPTLALFTSSSTHVAGGYTTVQTLTAPVDCRLCGAAGSTCPLGFSQCVVPGHQDLAPQRVAEAAARMLSAALRT